MKIDRQWTETTYEISVENGRRYKVIHRTHDQAHPTFGYEWTVMGGNHRWELCDREGKTHKTVVRLLLEHLATQP